MAVQKIAERYELLREIGKGGMGTVYEGRDTRMNRPCAIKILREEASFHPDARPRFEREAQAPARIGHPGLVEVYDAFVDGDGRMILVMELLEGESFKAIQQRGATLQQKLAVLLAALEPLAAAHDAGFVHRDMKPANVFLAVDADGAAQVKLVDFGVARDLRSGQLTQTGVIVGSTHYISPEQAHSARTVEPTADVFSMGVMLYEAASGKLPFADESPLKTLTNLASGKYPPLDSIAPRTPRSLVELVHECLAFQPVARPKNAAALRDRLAPLVTGDLPTVHVTPSRFPPEADSQGSRVRTQRDDAGASMRSPMEQADDGPRARGILLIQMTKALREAMAGGLDLELSADEEALLDQYVLLSGWYPWERFEWLMHRVHEHLMGGTDAGARRMGRWTAEQNLSGIHASFVYPGDVRRTLRSLPHMWSRYFDFGEVSTEPGPDGEVTVRVTDYPFAPAVHEQMLLGWTTGAVEMAGGSVRDIELTSAPSRGDRELVLRLRVTNL
jgi:serine/threonine protein kinase